MSTATRDQVMTKILQIVSTIVFPQPVQGTFTTWASPPSQKLRLWSDVSADQQPAAFLVTHRETNEYRGLGLLRRRLELGVWVYSRSDNTIGAQDLDSMMEGFETAFYQPDNFSTNCNTLGGLVYWCRIEGRVFKDPGDIDSQTLLIVPIVVEMP